MHPRKIVLPSRPSESDSSRSDNGSEAAPKNAPRFMFIDEVSAKQERLHNVRSFVQVQSHRKRKTAALAKATSRPRGQSILLAKSDSLWKCENCGNIFQGEGPCENCSDSTGSSASSGSPQTIKSRPTNSWKDNDQESKLSDDEVELEEVSSGTGRQFLMPLIVRENSGRVRYINPQSFLGAGHSDPFGTLAFGKEVDPFLNAFLSLDERLFGTPSDGQLMPARDFSFRYARDEPAAFMGLLAYTAASIPNAGRDAMVLKGRAIKLLSERLKKVDNPLIHAITQMWLLESRFGDPLAAKWHAQAISRMIAVQGGYKKLEFRLAVHVGWCSLTTPETLNLTPYPDTSYLQLSFQKFLSFLENIHELALRLDSPYAAAAPSLARPHRLHLLLSGQAPTPRYIQSTPRLYQLCRLLSLLYIHAIFIENPDSPQDISAGLETARRQVWNAQKLERYITMESLPCILAISEDHSRMNDTNRSLWVLIIIMVVKKVNGENLTRVIDLLYLYVNGKTYDPAERDRLWDPIELGRDFQLAYNVVPMIPNPSQFGSGGG